MLATMFQDDRPAGQRLDVLATAMPNRRRLTMKPLVDMAVYDDAQFYDIEFATRDHEIPFFLKQARRAEGPVLEVACGTGRLTVPLALAGVNITGLDVMPSMLRRAAQRAHDCQATVNWLEQDCRDIRTDQRFALIFSAHNSMGHLHDLDSVVAFLTSARRALASGGTLILEVSNRDVAELSCPSGTSRYIKSFQDDAGGSVEVWSTSAYDAATQVVRFHLDYRRDGAVAHTKQVSMRCFFPEELLALCRLAGLEVVRRHGDYDESPFTSTSQKQILFCRDVSGGVTSVGRHA